MISRYVSSADTASPRALNVVANHLLRATNRAASPPLTPQRLVPIPAVRKHATASSNAPPVRQPRQSAPRIRVPIRVPRRRTLERQLALRRASPPSDRERDRPHRARAQASTPACASRPRTVPRARARGVHSRAFSNRPNLLSRPRPRRASLPPALALALASSHRALQSSLDARRPRARTRAVKTTARRRRRHR